MSYFKEDKLQEEYQTYPSLTDSIVKYVTHMSRVGNKDGTIFINSIYTALTENINGERGLLQIENVFLGMRNAIDLCLKQIEKDK